MTRNNSCLITPQPNALGLTKRVQGIDHLGADITLNTSDELYAKASSGGDIKYYGNPEKITKKDGVSGNIRKQ